MEKWDHVAKRYRAKEALWFEKVIRRLHSFGARHTGWWEMRLEMHKRVVNGAQRVYVADIVVFTALCFVDVCLAHARSFYTSRLFDANALPILCLWVSAKLHEAADIELEQFAFAFPDMDMRLLYALELVLIEILTREQLFNCSTIYFWIYYLTEHEWFSPSKQQDGKKNVDKEDERTTLLALALTEGSLAQTHFTTNSSLVAYALCYMNTSDAQKLQRLTESFATIVGLGADDLRNVVASLTKTESVSTFLTQATRPVFCAKRWWRTEFGFDTQSPTYGLQRQDDEYAKSQPPLPSILQETPHVLVFSSWKGDPGSVDGQYLVHKRYRNNSRYQSGGVSAYALLELQTATELSVHNHIVPFLFLHLNKNYLQLDMAGAEMNLSKWCLQYMAIRLDMALCIIRQVTRALLHMHLQGFVHRDVKPCNILVSTDKSSLSVRLCDFGLTVPMIHSVSSRQDQVEVVTRWYRAPEACKLPYSYTDTIDTFAVGCILMELLTQDVLFPSEDVKEHIKLTMEVCDKPASFFVTFLKQKARTKLTESATTTLADLFSKLFVSSGTTRLSAHAMLRHPALTFL